MHDRVDAAERMAERERVGEVSERDLDTHPLGFEPARIAHQAAHRDSGGGQPPQQRQPDRPGCAGQQEHGAGGYRAAFVRRIVAAPGVRRRKRQTPMAYVIAEPCIGTKDNSCVEVCPVDCIHPTPDEPDYDSVEMLYIDPEECIDCDACVEACPVDACFAEDQLPEEWQQYTKLNSDYYANR